MADKILHKRSLTSGSIPTTSSLDIGELAINVHDGKLFLHQSGSSIDQIINIGESASFATSASYALTSSFAQSGNGSFSGSFVGDGSALTGISYERLSDFQSPYHYSGNATLGTSTSSTEWIINRIDFTTPGSPITLQGTGSWDNRTSLIYS